MHILLIVIILHIGSGIPDPLRDPWPLGLGHLFREVAVQSADVEINVVHALYEGTGKERQIG